MRNSFHSIVRRNASQPARLNTIQKCSITKINGGFINYRRNKRRVCPTFQIVKSSPAASAKTAKFTVEFGSHCKNAVCAPPNNMVGISQDVRITTLTATRNSCYFRVACLFLKFSKRSLVLENYQKFFRIFQPKAIISLDYTDPTITGGSFKMSSPNSAAAQAATAAKSGAFVEPPLKGTRQSATPSVGNPVFLGNTRGGKGSSARGSTQKGKTPTTSGATSSSASGKQSRKRARTPEHQRRRKSSDHRSEKQPGKTGKKSIPTPAGGYDSETRALEAAFPGMDLTASEVENVRQKSGVKDPIIVHVHRGLNIRGPLTAVDFKALDAYIKEAVTKAIGLQIQGMKDAIKAGKTFESTNEQAMQISYSYHRDFTVGGGIYATNNQTTADWLIRLIKEYQITDGEGQVVDAHYRGWKAGEYPDFKTVSIYTRKSQLAVIKDRGDVKFALVAQNPFLQLSDIVYLGEKPVVNKGGDIILILGFSREAIKLVKEKGGGFLHLGDGRALTKIN